MRWRLRTRELDLSKRCLVMGIVNVTPDSFSDGGQFAERDAAIAHARQLVAQGADILDIGGESTRPGSSPVPLEEELRRVVPVVAALAPSLPIPISIDTSKAELARQCLAAGAEIVNDVTALTGDPAMLDVAREFSAGVVLMHMQGTPRTMQNDPCYLDVVAEVRDYLRDRISQLTSRGIDGQRIVIDPGIGFGKKLEHNLALLAHLDEFASLGRPLLLGVSRKGLLKAILNRAVEDRLPGSLAALAFGLAQHAVHIARVHDVAATRDVTLLWQALREHRPSWRSP